MNNELRNKKLRPPARMTVQLGGLSTIHYPLSTTTRGSALLIMILFLVSVTSIIVLSISASVLAETRIARRTDLSRASYFVAESGIEDASFRVQNNMQIDVQETIVLGGVTAVTSISDISAVEKEIISQGDASGSIRKSQASLLIGTGVDFFYGVQVGEGGLEMDQGSRIEGAGGAIGNVYSNGGIVGSTGATVTGDATVAGAIEEDLGAQSTICNADQIVGQANPQIDYAQSFVLSQSSNVPQIQLHIKKIGDPGDRDVNIVADNGGIPGTSNIGKGKLKKSLVGSTYDWITVVLDDPVQLTQGVTYWLVLDEHQKHYLH